MTTRTFHVADILTHTTGRLLTPIGDVYAFLEWVSGEAGLMTHQLPRVSREVTPFLEQTFPDVAAIDASAVAIACEADVVTWLASIEPAIGTHRDVPQMPAADHTSIDPIAELKMMRPDLPVIVVGLVGEQ